jgi:protein-disulfide isomerase
MRAIHRAILIATAGVAASIYSRGVAAPVETSSPASVAAPSIIVPIDRLMMSGPLPDLVQGSPSAPITIIEYASMTCSHCAAFHETTWPELKSKYVDTGRVRFILREFPLDPLAAAAFMLARCAGPDKRNLLVDQLFSRQKSWAFVDDPIESLFAVAERVGMSQADFESCLKNQDLYAKINQSRKRAAEALSIESTPTFFVDGRKLTGEQAITDFDQIIDPPAK